MSPRQEQFVPIDRPAQLRALASPLRQELLDVLESAGPSAIAELAEKLGRTADSLYFHVRRLLKVGLIVEVERRQVGRHSFAVYDVAGRPLRIDRSKARRADLQAVVSGVMRLAIRDYQRGLSNQESVASGPARNHWGGRARGWLDERELARVNALLEELNALVRSGGPGKGRQPIAVAWVLAPTPPKRSPRNSKQDQSR